MLYLDDGQVARLLVFIVLGDNEEIFIGVRAVPADAPLEKQQIIMLLAEFYCQCYDLDLRELPAVQQQIEARALRAFYVIIDGRQVELLGIDTDVAAGSDLLAAEQELRAMSAETRRLYVDFLTRGRAALENLLEGGED